MNKYEFLHELEQLLYDIPTEERKSALDYYNDYFDDAERSDEEIINELGSAKKVAATIKADINDLANGSFTERGYETDNEEHQELSRVRDYKEQEKKQTNSSYNNESPKVNKGLLILLLIIGSPVILPLALALFGVVFGLGFGFFAAVLGIGIGFGAAGVALSIVGIVLFVGCFGLLFSVPSTGLIIGGGALICLAIGVLLFIAAICVFRVIPWIFKTASNVVRTLFRGRGAIA